MLETAVDEEGYGDVKDQETAMNWPCSKSDVEMAAFPMKLNV